MLRMCRTTFVSGKTVVLDSEICVARSIKDIEGFFLYVGDMIKKRRYCPKVVPGDLNDTKFEYTEVSDILIIEAITQDNK